MKLIALKDFRNVQILGLKKDVDGKQVSTVADAEHDNHIHKGAIISIGSDNLKLNGNDGKGVSDLVKLQKTDSASATVVAHLVSAGCVGDATDKELVKSIEESVAEDEQREVTAKKLNRAAAKDALAEAEINAKK